MTELLMMIALVAIAYCMGQPSDKAKKPVSYIKFINGKWYEDRV